MNFCILANMKDQLGAELLGRELESRGHTVRSFVEKQVYRADHIEAARNSESKVEFDKRYEALYARSLVDIRRSDIVIFIGPGTQQELKEARYANRLGIPVMAFWPLAEKSPANPELFQGIYRNLGLLEEAIDCATRNSVCDLEYKEIGFYEKVAEFVEEQLSPAVSA